MKITYDNLNTNGEIINIISETKVKSFSTKLKIAKLKRWFDEEVAVLSGFVQEIEDEFKLRERFEFDSEGKFIGDNQEEVIEVLKKKSERENELLKTEIDMIDINLTEDELQDVDLNAKQLLMLDNLKIFCLEQN